MEQNKEARINLIMECIGGPGADITANELASIRIALQGSPLVVLGDILSKRDVQAACNTVAARVLRVIRGRHKAAGAPKDIYRDVSARVINAKV